MKNAYVMITLIIVFLFALNPIATELKEKNLDLSHAKGVILSGRSSMDDEKFTFSGEIKFLLDNNTPVFFFELITHLVKGGIPEGAKDLYIRASCKKAIDLTVSDLTFSPLSDGEFFIYRIPADVWYNHELLFGFPEGKQCGFTIHEMSFNVDMEKSQIDRGDVLVKFPELKLQHGIDLRIKVRIDNSGKLKRVSVKGRIPGKLKKAMRKWFLAAKVINPDISGKKGYFKLTLKKGNYGESIYLFKLITN